MRDGTARTLLWIILALTVINLLLVGYVFAVVHHTVDVLQQIGDEFSQLGE